MVQRSRYLIKNLEILAISNFSSKILVFLLVPLYTSVLSTSEYGMYDLIISTVTFLFPILTANIVDAVMRFSMETEYKKEITASIGIKYVTISIAMVGLSLLISYWFSTMMSLNGLRIYVFLYYLFYAVNQCFIQLAKGLEHVKDMGIAGVLSTVVMIGANVFFLLVLKKGLIGFFVANILAQAVQTFFYAIRLRIWNLLRVSNGWGSVEREMLTYSIPLICTTLSWWINSTADKYTVTFMCGVAANGLLSVSYKIPSIISTLQGIFTQAWQISAIREYGKEDSSAFYGKTFLYLNVVMCGACSALIILSRPLAHILFSNNFFQAWQYVPFLLISTVMNCASGFVGPILSAKKDSKSMALSAIYGACANIALNIMLVYFIGVQGATIATLASSYLIYYFRIRTVKSELNVKERWRVSVTWILLCVQAVFEIYMSAWNLEILVLVVLLAINRKVMKEMISTMLKRLAN